MMEILAFFGILFCPIFTLGCLLIHYGHPILGFIAIIFSILKGLNTEKEEKWKVKL